MPKDPASPRPRPFLRRLAPGLILLSISSLFSLGMLETAARMLSPMPVFGALFDMRPYRKVVLPPGLKGVSAPAMHTANRWGMRGDDPPADWRDWQTVIAIGGSTTQCFHLDDRKTWPYRLQEILREEKPKTWVGNAGLDGNTTRAHALMMDKVIPKVKPKAVVVLAGLNDLWLSLYMELRNAGSPYDRSFAAKAEAHGVKGFLMEHSRVSQIAYAWKRVLAGEVVVLEKAYHKNWSPPTLEGAEDGLPPFPELLVSLPAFRRNILHIDSAARKLGARAVFLTQPILYGSGPDWERFEARHLWVQDQKYRISAATERRLLDVFNGELLSLCGAHGLSCLDLASRIPNDSSLYYDQCHFNDAGAERVAREVAIFWKSLEIP